MSTLIFLLRWVFLYNLQLHLTTINSKRDSPKSHFKEIFFFSLHKYFFIACHCIVYILCACVTSHPYCVPFLFNKRCFKHANLTLLEKQEWLKWCFAMICGCFSFSQTSTSFLFLGYFEEVNYFLFMGMAFSPFADIITDCGKILSCWKFFLMIYIPFTSHAYVYSNWALFCAFTPICNCLLLHNM